MIRLFYEEERRKSENKRNSMLKQNTVLPDLEKREQSQVHVELAKKAGIGKSSMAYLLSVYKSRPDLFELVFSGDYSINKAYTQMKKDDEADSSEELGSDNYLTPSNNGIDRRLVRKSMNLAEINRVRTRIRGFKTSNQYVLLDVPDGG